jgi:hypothetical protein
MRYAIQIVDDPELFGYIDCEVRPTFAMLVDAFEGEQTQAMLHQIPEHHFLFFPVH